VVGIEGTRAKKNNGIVEKRRNQIETSVAERGGTKNALYDYDQTLIKNDE
jgi:hypothetical protein